ncbi:MAG: hypothetical protein AB7O24_32060 [Kofleriaceae bacterium]
MLDPWIIEEILKKEEERRREIERRPELPLDRYRDTGERPAVTPAQDESERGVMIIDI